MSLGDPLRRRNAVRPTPVAVGGDAHHRRVFGASSSPLTAVIVASRAPRRGPDLEDAMAFPRPIGRRIRGTTWWPQAEDAPTVSALLAAAGVLVLTLTLPRGLVLPGLSILLIAVAFGLAALSGAGPDGRPSASRDVSAGLAFIGFGAALMTDPEPVLSLLEGSRRTP
jgi:hypothetical protein